MPSLATLRKHRLRMTKAQLIDQIDTLEQRVAAIEAAHRNTPMRAKGSDRYLANQELADLARFTSENPNPILRATPDGTVLYANDAAIAVNGLLKGRKKSTLTGDLAGICADASSTAEAQETEFESGDHIFAFSIAPVAGESYFNIHGRDITEHKQTEEERARKEAQLRFAFYNIQGGIRVVDEDGNYVFFNDQYLELYDFPPGLLKVGESYRIENLYQAKRGDFGPGDPEALTDEWLASRPRETEPQIWERTTVVGKALHVSTAPTPVGGFVNIVTDITERNRAEKALRKSEQRLKDSIEALADGFALHDADDSLVLYNNRYAELLFPGIADALKPGIQWEANLRAQCAQGLIPAADGRLEAWITERRSGHLNPKGPIIQERSGNAWIRLNERKAQDGGIVTIITDITELKRAEQRLHEKTEILQLTELITRAANEAPSVEEAVQTALDRVCAHTGWSVGHAYMLDEAAGDLVPSGIWHLDDAQRFETFRRVTEDTRFASSVDLPGRVLASGQPVWIFDVTKDPNFPRVKSAGEIGVRAGVAFPVLVGARVAAVLEFFSAEAVEAYEPLLDVIAQIGTQLGRAIERQQAEQTLRIAKERAEQALDKLTQTQKDLIQAEKMASLGQLTAGIAHEIKNPLNFIINFSETASEAADELKQILASPIARLEDKRQGYVKGLLEDLGSDLEKIGRHGYRADSIVKSMLLHARGDTGEREPTNLNLLVEQSMGLAYHSERARNTDFAIELNTQLDPKLQLIDLAPQEISRVLVNLFINGFYATQQRRELGLDPTYEPMLHVATRVAGEWIEIDIRDNGIGIPEDLVDNVFTPFFTTKPMGEGTGLGLSLSYDIITQQYQGDIQVESSEGVGTTFTVRLPYAPADTDATDGSVGDAGGRRAIH